MPAEMVPAVLAALDEEGIRAWLIGGWGIDALLGRQTRRHLDLDLAFDAREGAEERAIAALSSRGFEVVKRETLSTPPGLPFRLSARIVLDDGRRHLVDLHPVEATRDQAGGGDVEPTAEGRVAGSRVRCLTGTLQLALHQGYQARDFDRADVEQLRAHLDGGPADRA